MKTFSAIITATLVSVAMASVIPVATETDFTGCLEEATKVVTTDAPATTTFTEHIFPPSALSSVSCLIGC
ncbi:hypothetical protein D9757_002505 [Collybiopsis confluens]|uniref:Pheromone n=1 Tax=Collybiopsis confluens TaxID=2823264 RepID=A0A8H5MF02_9AGAR|nr:hypothetical protein D9757_002505 [Collybiopsis confluens]